MPNHRRRGTTRRVRIELRRRARLLQRRQPRRQLLWQFDFDLADVRLRSLRRVGIRQLHREARTIGFTGLPAGGDREFGCERQRRAVRGLERHRDVRARSLDAGQRSRDRLRVAVGGVEREARSGDRHVDVLDLQRDAIDMLRYRIRTTAIARDRQLRGMGIDFDLCA